MNGLAADLTALASAGLVVSIGGLWLGWVWQARRPDPRPLSASDLIVAPRIDRTRPQHPQLRIWNGQPWVDPRDLLWHDELDAAVARHPAGKARP